MEWRDIIISFVIMESTLHFEIIKKFIKIKNKYLHLLSFLKKQIADILLTLVCRVFIFLLEAGASRGWQSTSGFILPFFHMRFLKCRQVHLATQSARLSCFLIVMKAYAKMMLSWGQEGNKKIMFLCGPEKAFHLKYFVAYFFERKKTPVPFHVPFGLLNF